MFEAGLISTLIIVSVMSSVLAARQVLLVGNVDGLCCETQLTIFLTSLAWALYGGLHGIHAQVACALIGALSAGIVLGVGLYKSAFGLKKMFLLTASFVTVIGLLAIGMESAALALVSSLVMFVARIPELVEAWVRPGGEGVSVGGFITLSMTSMGWTLYGSIHGDGWIVASSLCASVQAIYMVARTLRGRSQVPAYQLENAPTLVMPRIRVDAA